MNGLSPDMLRDYILYCPALRSMRDKQWFITSYGGMQVTVNHEKGAVIVETEAGRIAFRIEKRAMQSAFNMDGA